MSNSEVCGLVAADMVAFLADVRMLCTLDWKKSVPYSLLGARSALCHSLYDQQSGKIIEISIPMEEGDPLGATPNEKLVITRVQAGTLADGHLRVGDQIVSINGIKISDRDSFFKALRYANPFANLKVLRDEKKVEEMESRVNIPADRERLIQRRDGFIYFVSKLIWQRGGPKLGLGIKHFQNRVLVSRCDENSIAATQLLVGDHMIDIDGFPVTDKDVARDLLIKNIQAKGEITSVIERPESAEAKLWTQQALTVQAAQPPSVQMNSDVRAIAARERAKVKEPKQPKPSILRGGACAARVTIDEQPRSHIIASDNEGRPLRPVKK